MGDRPICTNVALYLMDYDLSLISTGKHQQARQVAQLKQTGILCCTFSAILMQPREHVSQHPPTTQNVKDEILYKKGRKYKQK